MLVLPKHKRVGRLLSLWIVRHVPCRLSNVLLERHYLLRLLGSDGRIGTISDVRAGGLERTEAYMVRMKGIKGM